MLTLPDLALLRQWLDRLNIAYFECDACQALHLTHMQDINGMYDAKIDLVEQTLIFSAVAEIRQTAITPLIADLSQINASSINNKVYIDIQDDALPKLVICQTTLIGAGITIEQFDFFLRDALKQASQLMFEAQENDLLLINELIEDRTSEQVLH